ncbi:glycosyltransferase [Novosphingobium terrae]|uniref:glycosyltransferase n=1 Tax=Novosphingobium terrae TaxID=2726189 RepID=UPI0019824726|nr:glycosyltransferase [Novosphingobium terrae]
MILLSVGTQLPFDRLVTAVDRWAAQHREQEVIAQIGPSRYVPTAMKSETFIDPARFRALQAQASLMISHAGIGSIINAMELGKPIIILARDHKRGEHRNGHQIATVQRFSHLPGVHVARDPEHLLALLDRIDTLAPCQPPPEQEAQALIAGVRDYVETAQPLPLWRIVARALRGAA